MYGPRVLTRRHGSRGKKSVSAAADVEAPSSGLETGSPVSRSSGEVSVIFTATTSSSTITAASSALTSTR